MTDIQFHYWLQGPLELNTNVRFDSEQVEMIQKHIDIVYKKSHFISWLEGYLDGKSTLNSKEVKKIKEKLQLEFHNITKDVSDSLLTQRRLFSDIPSIVRC